MAIKKSKSRKIKSKQSYIITRTQFEDGTARLEDLNKGFNFFELIGVLDLSLRQVKLVAETMLDEGSKLKK